MDGKWMRTILILTILLFTTTSFGCIGVTSHLIYWMKGVRVDPEYKGLSGKKVAVICMSDSAPYGPDVATQLLTKRISKRLLTDVKKIQLIPQSRIENWIDNHDWDQIDYLEIGKGVDADIVLAVELEGYSLQEGSALYRGTTNYSVHVYDLSNPEWPASTPVFEKGPVEFAFPKDHPISSLEVTQRRFEQMFVSELGTQISHSFTGYEMPDKIARDAASINR